MKDCVTYTWEMESRIRSKHMSLYKIIGPKIIEVGKYSRKWGFVTGETLVFDTREVGELVAVLTCLAMLN